MAIRVSIVVQFRVTDPAAAVEAIHQREQVAAAYATGPVLLRLRELETLHDLAQVASARIYIGFDKHTRPERAAGESDHD